MCQKFLTHSAPSTKTQEALNAINGTGRSGISNATNILECHECGTTEHNGLKMCRLARTPSDRTPYPLHIQSVLSSPHRAVMPRNPNANPNPNPNPNPSGCKKASYCSTGNKSHNKADYSLSTTFDSGNPPTETRANSPA